MWEINKKFFKGIFSLVCVLSVISLSQSAAVDTPQPPLAKDNIGAYEASKGSENINLAANSDNTAGVIADFKDNKYILSLKSYGITPVIRSSEKEIKSTDVMLLGCPFGIKIYTDGVMIINIDTVDTEKGNVSPGDLAGLKKGDLIISINGKKVYTNEDVSKIIEASAGKGLSFKIKRNNKELTLNVEPIKSYSSGKYKTGIWVRDSSAGIGTLTFFSPKNGIVAGLGHGVFDSDTDQLLSINRGELVDAEILGCEKGKSGKPGELKGCFNEEVIADLKINSETGIYGGCSWGVNKDNLIEMATPSEVKTGNAQLLATVDGSNKPEIFNCRIEKIALTGSVTKNMVIKITDKKLIQKTGGIVQGMSGSPIIQNGKLVGALTHVFIDNPQMGYGIFAENMLETARCVKQLKEAG